MSPCLEPQCRWWPWNSLGNCVLARHGRLNSWSRISSVTTQSRVSWVDNRGVHVLSPTPMLSAIDPVHLQVGVLLINVLELGQQELWLDHIESYQKELFSSYNLGLVIEVRAYGIFSTIACHFYCLVMTLLKLLGAPLLKLLGAPLLKLFVMMLWIYLMNSNILSTSGLL